MIRFWATSDKIMNSIYIPKYYNPEIKAELLALERTHECTRVDKLVERGTISLSTGHEIGKRAYGTGNIPFVRTSDISNWEVLAMPKQGVSRDIYLDYALKQDVQEGDIFLVRDGTYLIGTNCFITVVDKPLLYQSHILKIRIEKPDTLTPQLLFLALNSGIVQKQIRSIQFTADIIDTIGQRFGEVVIPIPRSAEERKRLVGHTVAALHTRAMGKAFIKQAPDIFESILRRNCAQPIADFQSLSLEQMASEISGRTVTSEFGDFESSWQKSDKIKNLIFLPKYYDPSVDAELLELKQHCHLKSMGELVEEGTIEYHTGDEIGKRAYGTGDIPFIRTSDFYNWEIKHNPKQGISETIYQEYAQKQDIEESDIFLVRDGTYLVGSSCMVTSEDTKSLFCGGLYKIRATEHGNLNPHLLLGLLNSLIVKRQIRNKQFTRDVIDTLGRRLDEVILPIPTDEGIRDTISQAVKQVVNDRMQARVAITELASQLTAVLNAEED